MDAFVIIVSSPSGGGKTTIVNTLLKGRRDVKRVITATTRAPRKGERDGADYHFWTRAEFEAAIKKGQMAEWAKVHTDYYGVPKAGLDSLLKKGVSPVLVIDVQGAKTVRKHYKDALSVFIMPPSWTELKKRLLARPGGTNNIDLRLKTARKEAAQAGKYDYIIINGDFGAAVKDLENIIFAQKNKSKYVLPLLKKRKLI